MCGIAGYIDFLKNTPEETIGKMVSSMSHRGPDDSGTEHYYDSFATIGIGQARLSVIDLSSAGHQPMHYKNLSIVFNGEIYNYKEIRNELKKFRHNFISGSDTEVILHAYEQWGSEFVTRLIGMFVIVIYDKNYQNILFFRDRAGVKPIFYYWKNSLFIFGSELKAIHKHPGFTKAIDLGSLDLYFNFGYIPAPYSIFENTYKLEPGKILIVGLMTRKIDIFTYWSVENYYIKPKLKISYPDAKAEIDELLKSACNYRMIADVPIGVFLSGGYDSTAVTAILQKDRTEKLKTFTIGFTEGNNEAPFASEIAKYLGTAHTEFICTTQEAQSIITDLPYYYDEPFADSSAIPTMLVSKIARKQVTVALSADGGDEVFAGYTSYSKLAKYLNKINYIPDLFKSSFKPFLHLLSEMIPLTKPELKHKIKSVAYAMNINRIIQATELFRLSNSLPESYIQNIFLNLPQKYSSKYNGNYVNFLEEIEVAMAIDYGMYLQNDILTKVDLATMSVSLEGREPLLDHRLIEFAAQLPLEFKFDGITGKRILKDLVHDYVPKRLMDHPKAGFSLPIYSWLAGDLSYLIDEYLNEKAINESGLFNSNFIMHQVALFRRNKLHYKPLIWKLLMFQMWYFKWMK